MISAVALKYFQEVQRLGTMRAAAGQLNVAPSAISRQILLLEDELGAPLFERRAGRSRLKLTAVGEILLQYVKTNNNELQRLRSSVEAVKGLHVGSIRFGVTETFVNHFVPDFIAGFNRRHPRITFRVEVEHVNTLSKLLLEDELDVIMGYNPLELIDLEVIYQKSLPTYIMVSPNHPLASKLSVSLSDCVGHNVGLLDTSSPMKQVYDAMFARAKLRPEQIISSNSYSLLRGMAAAGMALVFVNEHMSAPPKPSGKFRYIPVRDSRVKPARFVVAVRQGRNLSIAASVFIDMLLEALPSARTE